MTENLIFLIESGKPLELVKAHIADVLATNAANKALLEELGASEFWPSVSRGTVAAVRFRRTVPSGFTKPNHRGASHPKKGTEWRKRFDAQVGYDCFGGTVAKAFGVPTSISYSFDGGWGTGVIGSAFRAAGFLYLSKDGPYALWVPDVPKTVAYHVEQGHKVEEPAKSWRPEIEGARLILGEEWDLLVAQHKLAEARAA